VKIAVILSAKFPTHKAYGVTTRETVKALLRDGHKVQVLSRTEINEQLLSGGLLLRKISKLWEHLIGSKYLSFLIFPFWQIFFALRVKNLACNHTALMWTREPVVACLLSFLTSKAIVLEVHHIPRRCGKLIIHILKNRAGVVIAPIKISIRDELGLEALKTPIATMAVNEGFLQTGKLRSSKRRIGRSIVVLGKISNRFQRESYEKLIKQLESFSGYERSTKITFVGIENCFESKVLNSTPKDLIIEFRGHINHDELPQFLNKFDIGLIPYLGNAYFKDTFPIKMVEYAAVKLLIVATDTPSHREILENRAYYYDLTQERSLERLLLKIWSGELDTNKVIEEGYRWAGSKTYSNRVNEILEKVVTITNLR
jgi:glycosyltransferase involved in cell wall biosynthesis